MSRQHIEVSGRIVGTENSALDKDVLTKDMMSQQNSNSHRALKQVKKQNRKRKVLTVQDENREIIGKKAMVPPGTSDGARQPQAMLRPVVTSSLN